MFKRLLLVSFLSACVVGFAAACGSAEEPPAPTPAPSVPTATTAPPPPDDAMDKDADGDAMDKDKDADGDAMEGDAMDKDTDGDAMDKEVIYTENRLPEAVATVTQPKMPTARPVPTDAISAPTPETSADAVWIATNVTDLRGQNGLNSAQPHDLLKNFGIAETLFRRGQNDETISWLATGWDVSTDLSKARVYIREGVPFQRVGGQDFGMMTAEDVAFSMNNANNAVTPDSIHGQAGDFAGLWGEWTAVNPTTIEFTFNQYDRSWVDDYANQSGQAFAVFSKEAYDRMGEEWVKENIVATGVYQVEEWRRDEYVQVEAVEDHWLFDAQTPRVRLLSVSEPTQRLSLLRTGQVDASHLEPKDAAKLNPNEFTKSSTEAAFQLGVFFSGNLWEDVFAGGSKEGQDLPFKSTFVHDLPWIGSPGKHGADDLEQAKAIRRALAIAIDRETINDTILGGLGTPVHVEYFSINNPRWQEKWEYPYDPDEAISLITSQDPDYQKGSASRDGILGGNAFEISVYAGPEFGGSAGVTGEVADAVAGYWREIGLEVFSLKFSYQTFRPTVVGRSNTHPWVTACDKGNESKPWHFPVGLVQTTLTRGGFGCGFESEEILGYYRGMAEAATRDDALQAADDYLDYVYEQNLQPGVVAVPDVYYFNNNKVAAWTMDKSASASINNLWDIELK